MGWCGHQCNMASKASWVDPATPGDSFLSPKNYFFSWSTDLVQHAQGPNRWHSSDPRQVSAQLLAPSEPAPGSSSGRETGFLRASLIQYLHLTDETSSTWQLRSRHLQLGKVSPDYLSTADLAIPLPFPWKTTGTLDKQSRSRRAPQALPITFTHCDIWDINTMSYLSFGFSLSAWNWSEDSNPVIAQI